MTTELITEGGNQSCEPYAKNCGRNADNKQCRGNVVKLRYFDPSELELIPGKSPIEIGNGAVAQCPSANATTDD